jgi:exonuclease VII small subunit
MMVQMPGVFAEFERASIVDRVIAGMERKAARGSWCGGSLPFGYDVDPTTGCLTPAPGEAPLVPVLFDRYAHGRDGARALAAWLNEAGHRTKAGRPWSHTAVLTVLRNPVYVGKVFFRDALHDGPHPHLVDEQLFARVQALLSERGEDWSKRASATSPFLLAGLVVCARCGKHCVGTSAVGNRYRYRYYTCFTRQRYGTKYCGAERLPAEDLEAAVLDALLCAYERTDLFDKAVSAARRRARSERGNHEQELAVVDAGITKAEDAIERYLSAFEAGTLSEAQCGKRLEGLAAKVRDLRERREELVAASEEVRLYRYRTERTPAGGSCGTNVGVAAAAPKCRRKRWATEPRRPPVLQGTGPWHRGSHGTSCVCSQPDRRRAGAGRAGALHDRRQHRRWPRRGRGAHDGRGSPRLGRADVRWREPLSLHRWSMCRTRRARDRPRRGRPGDHRNRGGRQPRARADRAVWSGSAGAI